MAANRRQIQPTTIGRAVDVRYPTNLAIILVCLTTVGCGIWTMMMRGGTFAASLVPSLAWAASVFLSWALARELDPDRWYSAFIAAVGGFYAAAAYTPSGLLLLFWFLVTLRFINRSTGVPPGWLDVVGYCALSVWLGFSIHWIIPLLALPALGLAQPKRFPPPIPFLLIIGIPITSLAFGHLQHWQMEWIAWSERVTETWILGIAALASLPVIHAYRVTRSVADRTKRQLEPRRVQWALTWALGAALVLSIGCGISLSNLAVAWAAILGAFVGWGIERLRWFAKRRLDN